MDIRINGIVNDSIVDGPGLRLAVFVQGCSHRCPGCHNPQTHDPQGGAVRDTGEVIRLMDANPLLDGITLSGGEPFEQAAACLALARAARERGLSVWAYSGYTLEALQQGGTRTLMSCWAYAMCWWTAPLCWRSARWSWTLGAAPTSG